MNDERIIVKDPGHSILGASGAHRWMNCAGSVNLIGKVIEATGPPRTSYAAGEGSSAHEISALCLDDHDGTIIPPEPYEFFERYVQVADQVFQVDDEMVDGVATMVAEVLGIVKDAQQVVGYDGDAVNLFIEHTMGSVLNDNAWGTSDAIILAPDLSLTVVDFKYGKGVVVEPDSVQNKYYGYLAIENSPEPLAPGLPVNLYIVQPRIPHPQGLVRAYQTTVEELQAWAYDVLLPAMEATENPSASLCIGEWCRFCVARDVCPALTTEATEFKTDVEPEHLTGDELGDILGKKKPVIAYFESIEKEAYRRICKGEKVKGQKLVNKQSFRIFKDGAEVAMIKEFGHDEVYEEPKLLSPAKLEKLGSDAKTFVKEWAYKPNNGLTIAPSSDKRTEVKRPMEEFLDRNF